MAKVKSADVGSSDDINEQQVVQFLQTRLDFFVRHLDLLMQLELPHENGVAVSLVARQMSALRERNDYLEKQLAIQHSEGLKNDRAQQRLHQVLIQLLDIDDINQAISKLQSLLLDIFSLAQVRVRLLTDAKHPLAMVKPQYLNHSLSAPKTLDGLTKANKPLCSSLSAKQLKMIYGQESTEIGSDVLIPLRKDTLYGFIALGDKEKGRFATDMGTDYLQRLGQMIAVVLYRLAYHE